MTCMPCQALVILTVYTCLGVPASIIFGKHGGFQGVRLVRHLCTWHLVTWDLACVLGTWAPGHLAPGWCAWHLAPGWCAWHLAHGTWACAQLVSCHLAGLPGSWGPGHLAPGTWAPGHLVTWHLAGVPGTCAPGTWLVCMALVHLAPGWCAWHLCTWAPGTWLVCLAPGSWLV